MRAGSILLNVLGMTRDRTFIFLASGFLWEIGNSALSGHRVFFGVRGFLWAREYSLAIVRKIVSRKVRNYGEGSSLAKVRSSCQGHKRRGGAF